MSLGKSEGSDPRRAPTLRNLIGGRRRSFPGQNVAKIWPSTHPKCGDLHFKMLKMQETIWKCKTLWKELQLIPWQPQRLEISELWKSMTIEPFKCPPISSYKLVDRFPKKSMGYHCILIPPKKRTVLRIPIFTNQPINQEISDGSIDTAQSSHLLISRLSPSHWGIQGVVIWVPRASSMPIFFGGLHANQHNGLSIWDNLSFYDEAFISLLSRIVIIAPITPHK